MVNVVCNNRSLAKEYVRDQIKLLSRSLGKKKGDYSIKIDEILYEKRLIANYRVNIERLLLGGNKSRLDDLRGDLGEEVFLRLRQFVFGFDFRHGFDPENNFDALPYGLGDLSMLDNLPGTLHVLY